MGRCEPCILTTIGNDGWLHIQCRAQLLLHCIPQTIEMFLSQNGFKVGMRCADQTVISVELTIGEPEPVVGPCVKPACMIIIRAVFQNGRCRTEIAGNTIYILDQIVCAGIESCLAFFKTRIESTQLFNSGTIIARCRRFRAKRA